MKGFRFFELLFLLGLPLMVLTVFVVYPIVGTIFMSFVSQNQPGSFTLENYYKVITEQIPLKSLLLVNLGPSPPWGALVHNALWILVAVPSVILLGLTLAYLIRGVPGASLVAGVIFLGMILPGVVTGLTIRFMFDADIGIFPKIFSVLGVEWLARTWTTYPQTALMALILGSIWLWLGFSVTLYMAGLESIPRDTIEAAMLDGASGFQIFAKIVAPQLRNVTVVVALMTVMWVLKVFDIVYVVTGGGPGGASTVLALIMYNYFASALEYNKAAAVSVILAVLTLVPAFWYIRTILRGGSA